MFAAAGLMSPRYHSFGLQQQNWRADAVAYAGGGGSQENVGEKAVTVGAHGDEVATFLLNPLDDFVGRFAKGEFGGGGYSG